MFVASLERTWEGKEEKKEGEERKERREGKVLGKRSEARSRNPPERVLKWVGAGDGTT